MPASNSVRPTYDTDARELAERFGLVADIDTLIASILVAFPHITAFHVDFGGSPECCCPIETCRCWTLDINGEIPAIDTEGLSFEDALMRKYEAEHAADIPQEARNRLVFLGLFEADLS